MITNSTERDFREYMAVAKNAAGQVQCQAKADEAQPLEKPRILDGLKRAKVKEKETAEMSIRIAVPSSGPPPTVEWFKDGVPFQPDGKHAELIEYRDTGIYKLVIHEALGSDAGDYGVRVTNKAGSDQSKAQLAVEVEELVPPEFVEPLHDTSAKEDQTVTFSVTVSGKPEPEIEWQKNGHPVQIDTDEHVVAKSGEEGHHSLTIKQVNMQDGGVYTCTAVNKAGSAETRSNFAVIEDVETPKFLKGLEPVQIKESESATMSVIAEGKPEPTIDWFKDGRPLQIDGGHVIKRDDGHGRQSISISDARLEDAGIYSCKAVNKAGADETTAKFGVIEDVEAPKFIEGLKPVEIKEGETVTMPVVVSGKPEPEVEWFKGGYPVQIDNQHLISKDGPQGSHSLTVANANQADAGVYSCKAVNKAGTDETTAKFGVIEDVEAPKFIEKLKEVEIEPGKSATLECTVVGKPEPEVKWFLNGEPILIDNSHFLTKKDDQGHHTLIINDTINSDTGVYSCKAVNKAGQDETSAQLKFPTYEYESQPEGRIEKLVTEKFGKYEQRVEIEEGDYRFLTYWPVLKWCRLP